MRQRHEREAEAGPAAEWSIPDGSRVGGRQQLVRNPSARETERSQSASSLHAVQRGCRR